MRQINIGDTVYFETLYNEVESMVVYNIDDDGRLRDNDGGFIEKEDVLLESDPRVIAYKENHPILEKPLGLPDSHIDFIGKATAWLSMQSGRVITKKLINEFSNYIAIENNNQS